MLLSLYLAAALAVDTTARPPRSSEPPLRGPAIVVHRQPAVPLVAFRLSLLADDPPGYAGAGHLVQHLVEARLRERVARVGGRVRLERTSDAVVFMVSGPAGELGYLAEVLSAALMPPRAEQMDLLGASRALAEERLADWETASLHVRSVLRAGLFPSDLPAAGTESAAMRLVLPGEVAAAWYSMYHPDRISIVAVGDVTLSEVAAAFTNLPSGTAARPLATGVDTIATQPLAPAEATRAWVGVGYPASGLSPAAVSVATRIAEDVLRERVPRASVWAEHWWTQHGQALVLIAAAPAGDLASATRTVGTTLARTREDVSEEMVKSAARSVRRDMLFFSRTPDRMADVIGVFTEREGDPDAADRFHRELGAVKVAEVQRVLDRMLDRSPVRATVPPQPLTRR